MARNQADLLNALREAGCTDFIDAAGKTALTALEKNSPEISGLLSDEARASLLEVYRQRMLLIYVQALLHELKAKIKRYDPAGLLLGKFKPDAVRAGAADLAAVNCGDIRTFLHEKYPLLEEYRACTEKNYRDSFSAFFDAFSDRKDEIGERFFGGQKIRKLNGFSTGGADIHRHGRCVIGVKTDAGTFFYKPHNCRTDVFYHDIVIRWFSDCTSAPDVIPGDGYAFVSCLEQRSVQSKDGIADYFYHFGILTALFHGLGSTDMHHENILASADKPSAVDIETIFGMPRADTAEIIPEEQFTQKDYALSLVRTCILPERMYKGPVISPLYTAASSINSLPEFDGRRFTVEGFEEDFIKGFHEGYIRMLLHREEIIEMLRERSSIQVRSLLRNTQFYAVLRQQLFAPENLTDEASRQKVYSMLRVLYKGAADDRYLDITDYEWKCLTECDIPYFCAALNGKDLCGGDPSEVVRKGYYSESICDAAAGFLGRLSEDEERFETELIRNYFAHAPTDISNISEEFPAAAEAPAPERIREEIAGILAELKRESVCRTDGTPLWISTVLNTRKLMCFGNMTLYAGIGAFCTAVTESKAVPDPENEAGRLAEEMCRLIRRDLSRAKTGWPKMIGEILPTGIYTGAGGLLKACAFMERTEVNSAAGLSETAAELIFSKELYAYRNLTLAEGAAGLVIALADMDPRDGDIRECIRLCADRILGEALPDRADSAYGCAGTGAALIAAFGVLRDERYYQRALQAFQKVEMTYDLKLNGWPDGKARVKFLAGKGSHAAGIFLASEYAKNMLLRSGPDSTDELAGLLDRISKTALASLLEEKTLTHSDTLDQGNALTVLALVKAGETEAAGRILAAMLQRKEQTGSFTVMEPGVRSTFDPSFFMGTLGIGYSMAAYLKESYNVST